MKNFRNRKRYLARAERTIPLGSQTFSKSRTQLPYGVSPYFVTHGRGSRVWDVDGNEYIDFVNGLASVTLGYSDPDVNAAVRAQLENGVIFSLPHPIEAEVAELICEMVPCAEMVRFGKNGSDATAGAIRLARAHTRAGTGSPSAAITAGRTGISARPRRNRGVPKATRDLTHAFAYNDSERCASCWSAHPGEFAAVMLEPMNVAEPAPGFLEACQGAGTRARRVAGIRRDDHRFPLREWRRAGILRRHAGSRDASARGSRTDFRCRRSSGRGTSCA